MQKKFAVLGNPIAHSLSPIIHQAFAKQFGIDLQYEKILVPEDGLKAAIKQFFDNGGTGLNITLPFKAEAFALAENISARGLQAKAVNTLWMEGNKLCADNTDGIGLVVDCANKIELPGKTILIIGAGGATRGILGPILTTKPQKIWVTNRTIEKLPLLQQDFPGIAIGAMDALPSAFDMIISATPQGLDDTEISLPQHLWHTNTVMYDLAYQQNHATPFVKFALSQGLKVYDGIGMLIHQAAFAFYQWHGVMPDVNSLITANAPLAHLWERGRR